MEESMPERREFALPDPKDIIRRVSKDLGLNPVAKPEWGYKPPVDRLFPEEADTVEARSAAIECAVELRMLLAGTIPGANPQIMGPDDVSQVYEELRDRQETLWPKQEPFPDYTLTHVLGAAKRQIVWLTQVKEFRETDDHDGSLKLYRTLQRFIEQILADEDDQESRELDDSLTDRPPFDDQMR
jgi:hypothetical protein